MALLTVGTVAFDSIESPFGKADRIVGGSATFIALSASYYTQPIYLVGVVGSDFPRETISLMQDKGIDTQGLQIKEGEKSFFWAGRYHADMNNRDTLITELNVLANFDPIIPEAYQAADFVLLGNIEPSLQLRVLQQMKHQPKLVMADTMNFWINDFRAPLLKTLAEVDILSVNDEEARLLSGEHNLVKAARAIMAMGPKNVIIKKGEHGALLFGKETLPFYAPALPLEVVFDPTGAGDTFAGGFIGYLASTGRTDFGAMKTALVHGSCMASFCVEAFGPTRLYELPAHARQERFAQFQQLSSFTVEAPAFSV